MLRAGVFLDHADEIFDAHPIHRLSLRSLDKHLGEVAARAELACLTSLDLREEPVRDAGLMALGQSPHLGRLQALDLSRAAQGGFTAAGLHPLLAGGPRSLTQLNLRDNRLGSNAAAVLGGQSRPLALRELNLSSTDLNDVGAEHLANSRALPDLKLLRVSYNPLGEAGLRGLLTSPHLAGLKVLEAYGTEMSPEARARVRGEFGSRVVC